MTSPSIDRRLGLVGNFAIKAPVVAVATSNITLRGEQTIDGVAVKASNAAGVPDRVLVVGQTDATQNGIYDVSASDWTRSLDADGNYDLKSGTMVHVGSGGTANGHTLWQISAPDPITVGTTEITWTHTSFQDASVINYLPSWTGAKSRTVDIRLMDCVDVKGFDGVLGDGINDDSAGINAASLAASLTGAALYFPRGTYRGKNLKLYTNSKWIGDGRGSVIKLVDNAGVSDVLVVNDGCGTNLDGSDATGNNHILVRDLQFDGNKANQTQAVPLIRWRLVKYSQITGCRFINSNGMAIDSTNGIDHCVFDGNLFQNNVGVDISIRFVSNRCFVTNNVIIGANVPVPDGGEGGSVTSDAINILAPNNTGSANFNCAEFVVSGNVVKGKVNGLVLDGVFDSAVTGNTFGGQTQNTISLIQTGTYFPQGITIGNNVITQEAANTYFGISVLGRRILVTGNAITSSAATPIYVAPGQNNTGIVISNNACQFTALQDGQPCIRVRDAARVIVSGNACNAGRHGIQVDTPTVGSEMRHVFVTGNTIYNSNRNGIRVENAGAGRKIRGVDLTNNTICEWGAQSANVHDGIFVEQSGDVLEDVHISGNSLFDYNGNSRDAIRFSGTVTRMVVEPNQKVRGINGALVTGYYSAAPTDALWETGQVITNFAPGVGGVARWVCTAGGSPGTWTAEGVDNGSFTPSVGGTATYARQYGRYVKVGKLVFFELDLQITALGTGSNSVISGLPFPAAADNNSPSVYAGWFTGLALAVTSLSGYITANTSQITMLGLTAAATQPTNAIAVLTDGARVVLGGCYEAAA